MKNEALKAALDEALTFRFASMLDMDETLPGHIFSNRYIQNRDKLIRRRSHAYYGWISTTGKRVACIIAAVLIAAATAFAVEPIRTAFYDFFLDVFKTHTVFGSVSAEGAPEAIEDIYGFTCDMSDYEIVFNDIDIGASFGSVVYLLKEDRLKTVSITQHVKTSLVNTHFNTEDAVITEVQIGDISAVYFFSNLDCHHYLWDGEDYVFDVYGNIDKSDIEKMILSVQIVD